MGWAWHLPSRCKQWICLDQLSWFHRGGQCVVTRNTGAFVCPGRLNENSFYQCSWSVFVLTPPPPPPSPSPPSQRRVRGWFTMGTVSAGFGSADLSLSIVVVLPQLFMVKHEVGIMAVSSSSADGSLVVGGGGGPCCSLCSRHCPDEAITPFRAVRCDLLWFESITISWLSSNNFAPARE